MQREDRPWQNSDLRLFLIVDPARGGPELLTCGIDNISWGPAVIDRKCPECGADLIGNKCVDCSAHIPLIKDKVVQRAIITLAGQLPRDERIVHLFDGAQIDILNIERGMPYYDEQYVVMRLIDCEVAEVALPDLSVYRPEDVGAVTALVYLLCKIELKFIAETTEAYVRIGTAEYDAWSAKREEVDSDE